MTPALPSAQFEILAPPLAGDSTASLLVNAIAAQQNQNAPFNAVPYAPNAVPTTPRRTFEDFYTEIEKRYPRFDYQPTQDEIAQLTAMRGRPEASLPLALGAMLSRDKNLSKVGQQLYGAVEASRQPFEYGEGIINPRTGEYIPDRFAAAKRQQKRQAEIVGLASAQERAESQARALADRFNASTLLKTAPDPSSYRHTESGQIALELPNGTFAVEDPSSGQMISINPGELIAGTEWQKKINDAAAGLYGKKRADEILQAVKDNPGAFDWDDVATSRFPGGAFGQTVIKNIRLQTGNLTDADIQIQSEVAREAALLIKYFYGAVLSKGEQEKAEKWLPVDGETVHTLIPKLESMVGLAEGKLAVLPEWAINWADANVVARTPSVLGSTTPTANMGDAIDSSGFTQEQIEAKAKEIREREAK